MYPRKELTALERSKVKLLARIAARRQECAAAAGRAAEPIRVLDGAMASWRSLSPIVKMAAVPLGFLLKRASGRRARKLGILLRWGPIIYGAVRSLPGIRILSRRG